MARYTQSLKERSIIHIVVNCLAPKCLPIYVTQTTHCMIILMYNYITTCTYSLVDYKCWDSSCAGVKNVSVEVLLRHEGRVRLCLSAKERVSFCEGRWQAFIGIERWDSGLMENMARLLQSPQACSVINAHLKKEDKQEKNEMATQKTAFAF